MYKSLLSLIIAIAPILSWAQCTIESSIDCQCEDASQNDCDLLPDITVSWEVGKNGSYEHAPGEGLQPGEIGYVENWFEIDEEVEAMGRVRVSAMTPNIGVGPLNLRGADQYGYRWMICYDSGVADTFQVEDANWNIESYCPDGSSPKHISWQRVYHKNSDGSMSFYEKMVGTMEYHPTHGHMHFDQWTIMSLRIIDENNMDNPTEWEIVGEGAKVGFCVMDLGNCGGGGCRDVETTYEEGTMLYETDFPNYGLGGGSYGCSPISQGISAGYNDTYGQHLDGMFLNIPLGTCNGDYAVVLEVPQVMVESNLDNNYTWFPITLTLQESGFNSVGLTSSVSALCAGDAAELTTWQSIENSTYLWSTGETTSNININQAGEYSVTVSDQCGNSYEESIIVNNFENGASPVVEESFLEICEGESATLVGQSNNTIAWYDDEGNTLATGDSYETPELFATETFYASSTTLEAQPLGPEEHAGDSDYSGGNDAYGYLVFDATQEFTLESVDVYTETPGIRSFIVQNSMGETILEHSEFIGIASDEPQTVVLNFDIPAGTSYRIGTDVDVNTENIGGENPQLKRTGTDGNLYFPYAIDGLVNIKHAWYYTDEVYTTYYYYLYNWQVKGLSNICSLVPVQVKVVECEQTSIEKEEFWGLNIYPNPSNGKVNIDMSLSTASDVKIELNNIMGQLVKRETLENVKEIKTSFDWSDLEAGIYSINLISNGANRVQKIVIQ
jgi:hypothetical protein